MQQAQVYKKALEACVVDNPGVCTAFLSWGITDAQTWRGTNNHPLPLDENYSRKPAYTKMKEVLKWEIARRDEEEKKQEEEEEEEEEEEQEEEQTGMVEQDISPDLTAYARKAHHINNKPFCVNCEGDIGECRWSWPRSDPKKGNSDLADWRCKPTYTYGQACNNNVMFCEDWCTKTADDEVYGCRWSWPTADP